MYLHCPSFSVTLPNLVVGGAVCLICIALRAGAGFGDKPSAGFPDKATAGFGDKASAMLGVEQFTTKQDRLGKILACDTRYVAMCAFKNFLGSLDRNDKRSWKYFSCL